MSENSGRIYMKTQYAGSSPIFYDEDGDAYFVWGQFEYMLKTVIRAHDNPWISDIYPTYIDGIFDIGFLTMGVKVDVDGEEVKLYNFVGFVGEE